MFRDIAAVRSRSTRHGARFAWNLGEKMGLGGLASLAPLAVWCAAWSAVLVRRARATQ